MFETGFWKALREAWADQVELHERLILLNRPWEEEFLHWADGELHGSLTPPRDGRRRSTTKRGWCPRGQLAARVAGPAA
jgi:hypothetical protein